MKAGGGEAPATGKMTSLQAATLGPSRRRCGGVSRFLEVLVWRCRARLPNVLVSFPEVLDGCSSVLVAGSLLMKWQLSDSRGVSSGK